jgi:hypothetical protein
MSVSGPISARPPILAFKRGASILGVPAILPAVAKGGPTELCYATTPVFHSGHERYWRSVAPGRVSSICGGPLFDPRWHNRTDAQTVITSALLERAE